MNILYIGDSNIVTTSYHRFDALRRIGHNVTIIDPYLQLKKQLANPLSGRIHYYTGYFFLQKKLSNWINREICNLTSLDLIWVNGGELLGPVNIKILKLLGKPVILYNNDDPTGGRDGNRFSLLLKALPLYDLCAVVREPTYNDFLARGIEKVLQVNMSFDEEAHKPYPSSNDLPQEFKSDVAFIGTWMRFENRDSFLLSLIKQGINVSIWGDRWQKSKHWKELKRHYRGRALGGRDYVAAIQGSKITIGLLSKGNRDLHTQRSLEIPYAGGLLCAERTSDHLAMYKEGKEAVFWADEVECSEVCKSLLKNDKLRDEIRIAGMKKIRALNAGNENICNQIIKSIKS